MPYRAALHELEHFSHVIVFWWADRFDSLQVRIVLEAHFSWERLDMDLVAESHSE